MIGGERPCVGEGHGADIRGQHGQDDGGGGAGDHGSGPGTLCPPRSVIKVHRGKLIIKHLRVLGLTTSTSISF